MKVMKIESSSSTVRETLSGEAKRDTLMAITIQSKITMEVVSS